MSKKSVTNLIGLGVVGLIGVTILVQQAIEWKREKQAVIAAHNETTQKANDLAKSLAYDSSNETVLRWARGDDLLVDSWGKEYKIDHNCFDKGACVRSAGPDGEFGTEDDIVSKVYFHDSPRSTKKRLLKEKPNDPAPLPTKPVKPEDKLKELKQDLEGAGRKAKKVWEDAGKPKVTIENDGVSLEPTEKKGFLSNWKIKLGFVKEKKED